MASIGRNLVASFGATTLAAFVSSCGSTMSESTPATGTAAARQPAAPGGAESSVAPAASEEDCAAARTSTAPIDPDSVETIQPEHRVPAFAVTAVDCKNFSSGELVGKRPFVVVFFSSWCKVCERKMPSVRAAAVALGNQVDFIGVALDEDETWENVSGFVERHGLSFPIVRGAHYRSFSLGYDPFGSIPVVVIVGRDGVVVDLQVGYSPFDYNRLVAAAALAEKVQPSPLSLPAPAP